MNKTPFEQEDILTNNRFRLVNYLPHIGIEQVRKEIWQGLTFYPKYISSKYFYDKNGSELFEAIAKLAEYYPTRTEKKSWPKWVKA